MVLKVRAIEMLVLARAGSAINGRRFLIAAAHRLINEEY